MSRTPEWPFGVGRGHVCSFLSGPSACLVMNIGNRAQARSWMDGRRPLPWDYFRRCSSSARNSTTIGSHGQHVNSGDADLDTVAQGLRTILQNTAETASSQVSAVSFIVPGLKQRLPLPQMPSWVDVRLASRGAPAWPHGFSGFPPP